MPRSRSAQGYRDDRELEAGAVWALEPRLCATERVDCGRVSDAVFLCGVPEAPLVARAGLPQTNFARSEGRFLASEKRVLPHTRGLGRFARDCQRVDRRVSGKPLEPGMILTWHRKGCVHRARRLEALYDLLSGS